MPIYVYECDSCGHTFERSYKMSEVRSTLTCPKCGHTSRKRINTPRLEFKGNGFYETDYKKKPQEDKCDTQ